MKRALVLLIAAALVVTAALPCWAQAQTSGQIADVPTNHWAYQAVKKLVDEGYLGLYPDNTFRGDQPVDRYTLAVLVAKLLDEVVAGQTSMTEDDATTLRRLTSEFRQELVDLSTKSQDMEQALAKYESDRTAMGADMAAWRDETAQARQEIADALQEIVQLKEKVAKLEDSLAQIDQQSRARDDALAQSITQNELAIKDLSAKQNQMDEKVDQLEKNVNTWRVVSVVLAVFGILL